MEGGHLPRSYSLGLGILRVSLCFLALRKRDGCFLLGSANVIWGPSDWTCFGCGRSLNCMLIESLPLALSMKSVKRTHEVSMGNTCFSGFSVWTGCSSLFSEGAIESELAFADRSNGVPVGVVLYGGKERPPFTVRGPNISSGGLWSTVIGLPPVRCQLGHSTQNRL